MTNKEIKDRIKYMVNGACGITDDHMRLIFLIDELMKWRKELK